MNDTIQKTLLFDLPQISKSDELFIQNSILLIEFTKEYFAIAEAKYRIQFIGNHELAFCINLIISIIAEVLMYQKNILYEAPLIYIVLLNFIIIIICEHRYMVYIIILIILYCTIYT